MSFQGLVTFKDVAVCFSQDQWSDMDPTQKEFYGEYVLEEDCGIVVSLCKEFQVFLEGSEHRSLSLLEITRRRVQGDGVGLRP